jgi:hypothetical protein
MAPGRLGRRGVAGAPACDEIAGREGAVLRRSDAAWRPGLESLASSPRRPLPAASIVRLLNPPLEAFARTSNLSLAGTDAAARAAGEATRTCFTTEALDGISEGGVVVWVAPRRGRVADRPRHSNKPLAELGASPVLGALKAWVPGD